MAAYLHKEPAGVELKEVDGHSSPDTSKVFDNEVSNVPEKYRGTNADARDMSVLGKKQVLRKLLSYYAGWLTGLGWQVYLASVAFLVGTIIQGLIALNVPTYVWQNWHGTLLAIAVAVFSIAFNTVLASRLPLTEGLILILHITGFFAIIITLWVMGPRGEPREVILTFTNNGGWATTGLSSMVGLLAPIAVLVGYDCSAHMAEEIKDAATTLPNAIMASVALNATLAFIMSVTLIFTVGDIESVLSGVTGYPFIQIFFNATQSYAATNVLTAIVIIMLTGCCISELAAASRQVWSFARDQGLPGWSWLSQVSPGWNIPLPAVIVSLVITALLACINIGSSVALNAITSLGALATLFSYYLTISCIVWRRLTGPPLPHRKWSLGSWGLTVNVAALLFLTPLIFFITWPLVTPVTASTMNWSSVMLIGVFIISTIYYFVKGRKEYEGPVVWMNRNDE
ncbi:hypothetical protein LTR64_008662 [Lithohypha guttulata]|uniref:uncharacterized protein n=1 Tax=Lithohypha guttulata TaxID=1690604 RepID=UPI002DE09769|nr:hypothetical protein LTR51_008731 [Lithohypha guttulata]